MQSRKLPAGLTLCLALALGLSLLIHSSLAACGEGCLSCEGVNNACTVCNVYDFYFSDGSGGCVQRLVQNCKVPSADSQDVGCYHCQADHFLDRSTRKCVALPGPDLISQCQNYHWSGTCVDCNDGFYLTQEGHCAAVSVEVANCLDYSDGYTCRECSDGFFYDLGSNACQGITKIKDCLVYSAVECQVCMSGFFLRSNFENSSSLSVSVLQTLINFDHLENGSDSAIYDSRPVNKCIEGSVSDCETHETFDTCKKCKMGFYLNGSRKCQSNPLRIITQCQVYEDDGGCRRCSTGYYLDQGRCISVGQVTGCLEFDTTSSDCLKCNNETHFQSGKACAPRSESLNIQYCHELDPERDGCLKCIDSYNLTDSKDKCLPHIPHCKYYKGSSIVTSSSHTNKNTLQLFCATCVSHFYPSSDKRACLPQSLVGCKEYDFNMNSCDVCGSGYYISSNACFTYSVKNCQVWNLSENKCVSCFKGFFLKNPEKDCKPYMKTTCMTFNANEDKCLTCPVGYFLTASFDCLPYTAADCLTYNSGTDGCATCHHGYYKDVASGISCYPVSLKNCLSHVTQTNECSECVTGHYLNLGTKTCHKYSKGNCDSVSANEDKCSSCLPGNYFISATGECIEYSVANCGGYVADKDRCLNCVSADFFLDPNYNCQPKNVDNCSVFMSNSPNGACQTCENGFVLVEGYCHEKRVVNCKTYLLAACTACVDGFFLKTGTCLPYLVPFCKNYVADKDECSVCVPFYKRVKVDAGCSSSCDYHCVPFAVANCARFDPASATDKCLECQKGYYLAGDTTCTKRSVVGCIAYTAGSNTCTECRPGLIFDVSNNLCNPTTDVYSCLYFREKSTTECRECYRGYYLDVNDFSCKTVPPVPSCMEYYKNTKLCKYCKPGKKPKDDYTECVDASKPPNCEIQEYNSDHCLTCAAGYYVTTTYTCSMQTLPKCEKYFTNQNYCTNCEENYYAVNGQCNRIEYDIQNCLRPGADLKSCAVCNQGFYPNAKGLCRRQSVNGCIVIAPNTNYCQLCHDGFIFKSGTCFRPLIEHNCLEIDEATEQCTVCKGAYFLDSGICKMRNVVDNTNGHDIYDPACLGNGTSDNKACTYCPEYMPNITFTDFTITNLTGDFAGCAVAGSTDFLCKTCQPLHGARGTTNQTCVVATAATDICKQQITESTAATLISAATDCATCRDYSTYWLDTASDTCTAGAIDNCGGYNVGTAEECTSCATGFHSETIAENETGYACADPNDTLISAAIAGCLQYGYTTDATTPVIACILCEDKKTTTADCSTAAPTVPYIIELSDALMSVTNVELAASTESTNGNIFYSPSSVAILAAVTLIAPSCLTSHLVTVIMSSFGDKLPLQPVKYDATINNDAYVMEFARSYPYISCDDNTLFTKALTLALGDSLNGDNDFPILKDDGTATGTQITTSTLCKYFLQVKAIAGAYRCLSCWDTDKVPVVRLPTHTCARETSGDNSCTAITYSSDEFQYSSVSECVVNTDDAAGPGGVYLTKSYMGMSYYDGENADYLTHNAFTQYDNCVQPNPATDPEAAFVLFMKQNTTEKFLEMHSFRINSVWQSLVRCVKMDDTQILTADLVGHANGYNKNKLPGGIDNCQVHSYEGIATTPPNLSPGFIDITTTTSGANFGCLSCAPGFKPTFTTNAISACDAIASCDLTDATKNTWMNACETPLTNFSWSYDATNKKILYHTLVDSTATPNCLAYDGTGTACKLCLKTHMLNKANTCVIRTSDTICTTQGIPYHTLDGTISANTVSEINFDLIKMWATDLAFDKSIGTDCTTCSTGKNMFITNAVADDFIQCGSSVYSLTPPASPDATNCATLLSSDNTKCVKCNSNFIVVTASASATSGTCEPTDSGPLSTATILTDCAAVISTTESTCTSCDSGKTLYKSTGAWATIKCYDTTENADCDKIDSSVGNCKVCKPGFVASSVPNEYKCEAKTSGDSNCDQGGYKGECYMCTGTNYFPIHYTIVTPTNNLEYTFECVDQGSPKLSSFAGIIYSFNMADHTVSAAKMEEPSNFLYFAGSDAVVTDDYLVEARLDVCLTQNFTALTANCDRWSQNSFQCSKCKTGYYLNTRTNLHNECKAVSIDNCDEHNGVVDGASVTCKRCNIMYKANSTLTECNTFTIPECRVYDYYNKICFTCSNDRYIDAESNTCKLYKNKYMCLLMSHFADKCIKCAPGSILDEANGVCRDNVVPNCLTSSGKYFNRCEVCMAGYSLFDSICRVDNVSKFCDSEDSAGVCTSCLPGYALIAGFCVVDLQHTIKGCILYDPAGFMCQQCANGLLVGNGYCFSREMKNCKVVHPEIHYCRVCNDGYWNQDGQCMPRQNFTCKDYANLSDECTGCKEGLFLKDGKCSFYSAQNCEIYQPARDECLSCKSFYFMDTLTQKCLPYTVANCISHDPFRDMCTYCIPEYYRDNRGLCLPRNTDKCLRVDPYANACLECSSDYYLSDGVIDIATNANDLKNDCLPYTVQYCQKFNPRDNACIKCKDGFYKNPDNGNCYRAENFNCKEWNSLGTGCRTCLDRFYLSNEVCYPHSVQACGEYSKGMDACLNCKDDHFYNHGECIKREAANCLGFDDKADLCSTCRDQFFFDNGDCIKNTSLNCATLSREHNSCLTCLPNFFSNNGKCLPYSVTCLRYDPFANACKSCPDSQYLEDKNKLCINYSMSNCATFHPKADRCLGCDPLHFWSDGYCKPYSVSHCDVFHSLFDECVTCKEGFYSWGKTCRAYNLGHCGKMSMVADVCLACNEGHFPFEGKCHHYYALNCATFNPERDACVTCLSGAYHRVFVEKDFFKCEKSEEVENCQVYNIDKNACYECVSGFYFEPKSNTCHPNPSAVSQCSFYTDEKICKECFPPYYLDTINNLCVHTDDIIPKCIVYGSNSRCSQCEVANLLSDNLEICQRIYEFSCQTYIDPRNCASCKGNTVINYISDLDNSLVSGLNGEDTSIRRSICVDSGLANCTEAQENYPQALCRICDQGFFKAGPSDCKAVTKTVEFCETYFSDGICAECEPNYLLSKEKTQCQFDLTFLGENCQQGKFYSKPHCARGRSGFYFDTKGNCQKCTMEGCALCPSDAPENCRLCINGYHMTKDLKCEQISLVTTSESNVVNRMEYEEDLSADSEDSSFSLRDIVGSQGIFQALVVYALIATFLGHRD